MPNVSLTDVCAILRSEIPAESKLEALHNLAEDVQFQYDIDCERRSFGRRMLQLLVVEFPAVDANVLKLAVDTYARQNPADRRAIAESNLSILRIILAALEVD